VLGAGNDGRDKEVGFLRGDPTSESVGDFDSCKNMCICYGLFWKRITGKEMLGIAPAKVALPEGSPKVGGQNP